MYPGSDGLSMIDGPSQPTSGPVGIGEETTRWVRKLVLLHAALMLAKGSIRVVA